MWTPILVSLHYVLTAVIIIRVLLHPRMQPPVRLAWVMVVGALPLVGFVAYVLFGEIRMRRAEVRRMAEVRHSLTGRWQPSPERLADPPVWMEATIASILSLIHI